MESSGNPSVKATGITAILQVAERFGVSRSKLLSLAHLEPEWLRHADDRLPVQRQFDVYRLAAELTGQPDIGLYVHWNRVTRHLRNLNRFHKVVVHSIAFTDNEGYQQQLEKIAEATGGEFRVVE